MGWLNFTGMKTHQDLFSEIDVQPYSDFNGILSEYIRLLDLCGYYHDQFYKSYSYNNSKDTEYYEKEIENIETQLNEFESKYPWVKQEINRYL